jgi:hypothetical protein
MLMRCFVGEWGKFADFAKLLLLSDLRISIHSLAVRCCE